MSYWAKRRKIRKGVQNHLAFISEQNAIENDELSDLENSNSLITMKIIPVQYTHYIQTVI